MYSTDPNLNRETVPSLKEHSVNFRSSSNPEFIVYGFEDIRRTAPYCDHDFNDLVYSIKSSPVDAFVDNSYNSYSKQRYTGTILCEDLKNRPNADLDYNDFVVEYNIVEHYNDDKIKSIDFKLKGLNRGASFNHDFGVSMPGIEDIDGLLIYKETYIQKTGEISTETIDNYSQFIPLIKDNKSFLPPNSFYSTNTVLTDSKVLPSFSSVRIIFPDGGIDRSRINNRYFPYNFYLKVYRSDNPHMWTLYSDKSYTDISTDLKNSGVLSKKKILILEEYTNFRCPIEKQPLRKCYYKFKPFLAGDSRFSGWYTTSFRKDNLVFPYVEGEDTRDIDSIFDFDKLPVSGNFYVCCKNNVTNFTDVNWENIDSQDDNIKELLANFGKIAIKVNSEYIDINNKYNYIYLDNNTITLSTQENEISRYLITYT